MGADSPLRVAAANGVEQQLNALAAHDIALALNAGDAMIGRIAFYQLAHGADPYQIAEYLQLIADSILKAGIISGRSPS